MKTKLLKKLRRRFLSHIKSAWPLGEIYCYDKKYKHNGRLIKPGLFIEALHEYYRSAINYYRYVNQPLWYKIKKAIKLYRNNKIARTRAMFKYNLYYGEKE